MRLKYLLVFALFLFMISCKARKNNSETTKSDSSKTSLGTNSGGMSTAGNWSLSDKDDFVRECVDKASVHLGPDGARTYCNCMQEKIESKYPEVKNTVNIDKVEMAGYRDACIAENNLDPDKSLGNNSQGDGGNSPWSAADKKEFMDNCTPPLTSQMGASKANNYCECMLQKLMVAAPNSQDASKVGESTMTEWAKDCLK